MAAQLIFTVLSPNNLASTMLPTLSAAVSSRVLLIAPSFISNLSSPSLWPSSAATELPLARSEVSPLTSPKLVCIGSKVGNSCLSLR